jgi:asparagine synthase (glutamine-hydrolysing)
MCGICGIASLPGSVLDGAPIKKALLEKMNAAIYHRGPDGDGFYIRSSIGLAMRRLAIIDLVTGSQPMSNEDETIWIVFNGEIYNYQDLRLDLEKRGHQFRTNADTESIIHLYEEYGADCVKKLRGMFAFAIWNERTNQLFIARDRLGKKPLYYAEFNNTLYFGSELPSLLTALQSQGFVSQVSLEAIELYLSLQYIPEPMTPFNGVFKLPAAHHLWYDEKGLRIERYWQVNYLPKWAASEDELASELRDRVREAVQIRLMSDVPLGAHLSGGIDSSIVVAMMAEASSSPVKTFSVGFEEGSFSELPYARQISQRYQTEHHEFVLTYENIPHLMQTLFAHLGEPLADPSIIPLYHLSRLTRQYVTVALNGDGGDEAFAGYQRYWLDSWANHYLHLPSMITHQIVPRITSLLPDHSDRPIGGSWINGLKRLKLLTQVDARASILRWGSYFSPEMNRELWNANVRILGKHINNLSPAESLLISSFDEAAASSSLDRTLFVDMSTYLPGDLLVKADRITMAHSLEGRSPFLDHELFEWAARLPESMKVRGAKGKYLLRKAFADYLPEKVQQRGKQGFGIPIGAWLRGDLSGWARDIIFSSQSPLNNWFDRRVIENLFREHLSGQEDHGKRLWALVVLGQWANQHL